MHFPSWVVFGYISTVFTPIYTYKPYLHLVLLHGEPRAQQEVQIKRNSKMSEAWDEELNLGNATMHSEMCAK